MTNKEIYFKLNAESDEDILEHFPKRYDDNSLSDLSVPFTNFQKFVVFGKIENMTSIMYGNLIYFDVKPVNSNYRVKLALYNQPFYKNVYKKGDEAYFYGTYKEKRHAMMITLILKPNSLLVSNRYKPYYNLPKEVSQTQFYKLVNDILKDRNMYINEVLPRHLREKYRFLSRYESFKRVHLPSSKESINEGLRLFKYEECLKYCLKNLALKKEISDIKKENYKKIDTLKINEFVKSLPYKLTKDQVVAIREIVNDMNSSSNMNRLLEGDVGTGKTIVALTAIYASYIRGGQSVLLAPTVTLARQHYFSAIKVLSNYGINIAFLDNSLSKKEMTVLLKSIKEGDVDVVIGTHNVFQDKVIYKNLSLAVIDEQHKFGVNQRDELISKGKMVDHLMMSATPIPQTMSRIINLDLDISSLRTFPSKRRSVVTKVVTSSSEMIGKSIKKALDIKRQVFIVAPKIEASEASSKISAKSIYDDMAKEYGEVNVALLTGKTKKEDQKNIYDDFVNGKKLILVSTSLIEVGVDVKTACLMVIYEANYFGMASIHQLRGRIGRSGEGALALLVYDGDDEEAVNKLDFLATHDNGEDVSIYDLEHRGAGTLGKEKQSGESELQVANFVKDKEIFKCAREDALKILDSSSSDDKTYLNSILQEH